MHREVDRKLNKKPKKTSGEVSLAIWRIPSCEFQDAERPKSNSILRNGIESLEPMHSVSTWKIVKGRVHGKVWFSVLIFGSAGLRVPKFFEDRSEEETLKQVRCARRDAWKMAQAFRKRRENDNATFYSPSEVWVSTRTPFRTKPEDWEFAVDSGASMIMLSRQDPNSAEPETFEYPELLQRLSQPMEKCR